MKNIKLSLNDVTASKEPKKVCERKINFYFDFVFTLNSFMVMNNFFFPIFTENNNIPKKKKKWQENNKGR